MIEFKVEENCNNYESTVFVLNQCKQFILDVVSAFKIDTLGYFVVADDNISLYCDTVSKYSTLLNIESAVTNDDSYNGAGKSLDGITNTGDYQQVIIIKSGIILGLLMDLYTYNKIEFVRTEEYNKIKFISIKTVTHELGHVIDNQNMYNHTKKVDTECKFNINARDGYNQYIKFMTLGLLGEYYAEYNMYQVVAKIDSNTDKDVMLEECVKSYSIGESKNQVLDRVHRILYLYMHWLAYCHEVLKKNSFNDTNNYCDEVLEYRSLLEKIELEVALLCKNYPNWDMVKDLGAFEEIVNDLINFEVNKHIS